MNVNRDDVIRRIEMLGGQYDPDSNLSLDDQLLICESLIEATPVNPEDEDGKLIQELRDRARSGNVSVNGSVNGGCKRTANTELSQSKHNAITELSQCGYRTSVVKVARLLEEVFREYPSNDGHWFYIAQHWAPRQINYVIKDLIKLEYRDNKGIKNPPALFTFLIKKRKRRKSASTPLPTITHYGPAMTLSG